MKRGMIAGLSLVVLVSRVFTNSDGTDAVRVVGEVPIAELEAILTGIG